MNENVVILGFYAMVGIPIIFSPFPLWFQAILYILAMVFAILAGKTFSRANNCPII